MMGKKGGRKSPGYIVPQYPPNNEYLEKQKE